MTLESSNSDFANLWDTIRKQGQRSRLILGIDGLSRSGKTTFAEGLRQNLVQEQIDVCVFHLDDHIVERKRRYDTGHEPWYEYYALQWDVPDLRENLFAKLRRGSQIVLPFYNDALDERITQTVFIPAACVVIVEGVFLQRPQWRSFLDYCDYLDCPREIRFSRESRADPANLPKFENRYWKAEDYYLQMIRPAEQADVVVIESCSDSLIIDWGDEHVLGLPRNTVRLQSYDPTWRKIAEHDVDLFKTALGTDAIDVQHVGSTAIDGLDAKPIIDIVIGVASLEPR